MEYQKGFDHTNTTDAETTIISVSSTSEEPKTIVAIAIIKDINAGILRAYHEREKITEDIPTLNITESNFAEIPVGLEIPIGDVFKLTLHNKLAGTNAGIQGFVKWKITGT